MNFLPIFSMPSNNYDRLYKRKHNSDHSTFITLETGGIGYFINISVTTFSKLEGKSEIKILDS